MLDCKNRSLQHSTPSHWYSASTTAARKCYFFFSFHYFKWKAEVKKFSVKHLRDCMRSTVLFWVSQYKTYTLIHWSKPSEKPQKQLRMKHTMFKEKLKNWVCSVLHKVLRVWGKRHRDLCCLQYPRRKYRENADTPLLNILSEGKKAQDNGQKMQHKKFWLHVKKKKIPIKVFKQDAWMVWNSSTGDNQNLAGQAHKQASYHWFEQEKEFLV